jgi:hypothetical protein
VLQALGKAIDSGSECCRSQMWMLASFGEQRVLLIIVYTYIYTPPLLVDPCQVKQANLCDVYMGSFGRASLHNSLAPRANFLI